MIGPAGENLVRYACIMHGLFDAAGRCGLGAVMGSKNLKAVAVRGSKLPAVADPDGIKALGRWLKEHMEMMRGFSEYGTGSPMARFEQLGNLPIRNFRDGVFPAADSISAVTLKDSMGVGMEGCFACPVRCKKVVAVEEPFTVDRRYGGPEYETLGALGSACGVDDLKAVAKGSERCNALGLDTISTGVTIAFAMECFENGLLSKEDTGGLELRFGNAEAMLQTIEQIALRQGIGALLAEGSARAGEQIGRGAESFAVHVKQIEIPMHEPRLNKALALGYMVHPHGPDHMNSLIDIFYSAFGKSPVVMVPDAASLGLEPAPFDDIGPRKVALVKAVQSGSFVGDALLICQFLPYSYKQVAELTAAVTGWDTSVAEQLRVAERILTTCRLFNLRAGLTADDDRLPPRFFQPTHGGALAETALDHGELERAKRYYYDLMGWDRNGVPKPEKLEELGIERKTFQIK